MRDEAQYRKRFRAFLTSVVCLSCVLLIFYLPYFGVRLFAPMVDVSITMGLAAVIVCLSFRQIQFQRRRIRRYLQSSHAA